MVAIFNDFEISNQFRILNEEIAKEKGRIEIKSNEPFKRSLIASYRIGEKQMLIFNPRNDSHEALFLPRYKFMTLCKFIVGDFEVIITNKTGKRPFRILHSSTLYFKKKAEFEFMRLWQVQAAAEPTDTVNIYFTSKLKLDPKISVLSLKGISVWLEEV